MGNSNTCTSPNDVSAFLGKMYETVSPLIGGTQEAAASEAEVKEYTPPVTARKSLSSSDVIVGMIDGKLYKTLRRHLSTNGMTPAESRVRCGLKADYPIVAATYSESRRAMAKKIGLGRKPRQTNAAEADAKPASAPSKRKTKDAPAE
ncbi:MucR family transcriptional regulator [Sphingomonas sp. PP-F2F-A104-K0414]|uniref:MucR family transcriptional regulator n=1 Tax=Sphingomonas sp. PP-F2F-A104-K0414 TaxID=2135661 RepID=UPI0032609FFD